MPQFLASCKTRRPPGIAITPTASANDSAERLLRRCQAGDLDAREDLVRHFLPLTKRLAARYRHSGDSQDDLEQVACVGLLKAIDRYDATRGEFASYAVPNILGELKRHRRDKGWVARMARPMQDLILEVGKATDELSGQLGRSPTARDLAEHSRLSLEEVLEALEASSASSPRSLDEADPVVYDRERTLGDGLGKEDSGYASLERRHGLSPAFRALPPQEQKILKLRFVDDLPQSEIADQVGTSKMHVSRLLRRSLDRLAVTAE